MGGCCGIHCCDPTPHGQGPVTGIGPVPDYHYEDAALKPDVVVAATQLFALEAHGGGHTAYLNSTADGDEGDEFVLLPPAGGGVSHSHSVTVAVPRDPLAQAEMLLFVHSTPGQE